MTTCNDCETVAHCLKHGCIPKVRSTINMAREAGNDDLFDAMQVAFLERFEALVRADERTRTWTQAHWTEYERSIAAVEREACAKVCDDLLVPVHISLDNESLWEAATLDCADAIRARGNK